MSRLIHTCARHCKTIWLLAGIALLSGCIVTPRTVHDSDHGDCRLVTRKWELETSMVGAGACTNEACVAALLALPVVSGAISGSIVIVGNTLHWLEAQGRCSTLALNQAERDIADSKSEPPAEDNSLEYR